MIEADVRIRPSAQNLVRSDPCWRHLCWFCVLEYGIKISCSFLNSSEVTYMASKLANIALEVYEVILRPSTKHLPRRYEDTSFSSPLAETREKNPDSQPMALGQCRHLVCPLQREHCVAPPSGKKQTDLRDKYYPLSASSSALHSTQNEFRRHWQRTSPEREAILSCSTADGKRYGKPTRLAFQPMTSRIYAASIGSRGSEALRAAKFIQERIV